MAAVVLEAAELEAEELRLGDLGEHLGEPGLLDLRGGDRLAVELHALLGVAERLVVAGHGGADRAPGDPVAGLGEAHQRALEPAGLREERVVADPHVLQRELAGVAGEEGELPLLVARLKPGVSVGTMKPRMEEVSSRSPVFAQMMAMSAVDPLVIHILAPLSTQPSALLVARVIIPPGLEPKSGSVRPKQPITSPARHARKVLLLLLLAAEGVDRVHAEGALHGGEGAHAGVAALELLHDEPVGDVVEPGAAVLLGEVGAEHPELGHPGMSSFGKRRSM
jgi:hypothetical protein